MYSHGTSQEEFLKKWIQPSVGIPRFMCGLPLDHYFRWSDTLDDSIQTDKTAISLLFGSRQYYPKKWGARVGGSKNNWIF